MKKGIHLPFFTTGVTCACGHTFTVGTTIEKPLRVETCYNCHPFYTGKQKLVDTAGRVDKFRQRAEAAKRLSRSKTERNEEVVSVVSKADLPIAVPVTRRVPPKLAKDESALPVPRSGVLVEQQAKSTSSAKAKVAKVGRKDAK